MKQYKAQIILIVLTFCFTLYFYAPLILSPNSFLLNLENDAIKNYFTFTWFIKNNPNHFEFTGLNYPFGEHFLYTDCHPFLAYFLSKLNSVFPFLEHYSIGILHFIMVASIFVTSWFLFLILKELEIDDKNAVAGALGLLLLSPQFDRLMGHYALFYSCCIPVTLFLVLKIGNNEHLKKYYFLLFSNILFWLFTHAYLGLMSFIVAFGYIALKNIYRLYQKNLNLKTLILEFFITIFPIFLFLVFIKLTDSHAGRTNNPWGFFEAHANFYSVFFSNNPQIEVIFKKYLPRFVKNWEGESYIGIVPLIAFLVLPILFFIKYALKLLKKKNTFFNDYLVNNKFIIFSLIIGTASLFLAMGYPFVKMNHSYLDYFPLLKQFRAIGRFAWIFYFTIGITTIFYWNKITKYLFFKNLKTPALLLTISFPILCFFESFHLHSKNKTNLNNYNNLFIQSNFNKYFNINLNSIDFEKFQAIIPLPYFHIGSENFSRTANPKIYALSQLFSYHSFLPNTGSYLTRTSINESKLLMQIFAEDFYQKNIQNLFPNRKPFLIVCGGQELTYEEEKLLKKSNIIFENDSLILAEIAFDKLFQNTASNEIDTFLKNKNLFLKQDYWQSDSNEKIFFENFDHLSSEITFQGKGSFKGIMRNFNQIFSLKNNEICQDSIYIISFWMYHGGKNFGQDQLDGYVFLQETNGKETSWVNTVIVENSFQINDKWSLIEVEYKPKFKDRILEVYLKGDDWSFTEFYIDNLFVYKKGSLNYKILEKKNNRILNLFKNNHIISVQN